MRNRDSHLERLRKWTKDKEEFMYNRGLRQVMALVPNDNREELSLDDVVDASTELDTMSRYLTGRAFVAAMDKENQAQDYLTAAALSASLSSRIFNDVFKLAHPRLQRGMRGKLMGEQVAHGINQCLALGMLTEARALTEITASSYSSSLINLGPHSQYALYSMILAQRYFQFSESPWPPDLKPIGGYKIVIDQWPNVQPIAIESLLKHHELALAEPDTYEPAWEWYLISYRAFPFEVLALSRILNIDNNSLRALDHALLNPWLDIRLTREEGPRTAVIRELEAGFAPLFLKAESVS